ncbi:MAG: DMT family transporter, partial [Clostridiales Family XIII bacterium]|nr:DMT family transporter [Clostridiales Family XIII bacterium]
MKKKVIVCIIISALIFATMEVALKIAGTSLDPFQMTFLRFFIGGVVLLPVGIGELRKNRTKLNVRLILHLILLGFICVPLSMILFQYGVMNSNASTAAVIFCVNPMFTAFFAHFLNKNDKLSLLKIISLVTAVPGIILLIRPWDMQAGNTPQGVLLTLGAAALFALYSVLGTRTIGTVGAFAQTSMSFLFGSAMLLVLLFALRKPVLSGLADNLPEILYLGIVVTGAGYLFYFLAIRYSNATTGSVTFLLKPAMAPVIAVIVLHEHIAWTTTIGIVFILAA